MGLSPQLGEPRPPTVALIASQSLLPGSFSWCDSCVQAPLEGRPFVLGLGALQVWVHGIPWWLSGKESAYNAGDAGDVGSIPG